MADDPFDTAAEVLESGRRRVASGFETARSAARQTGRRVERRVRAGIDPQRDIRQPRAEPSDVDLEAEFRRDPVGTTAEAVGETAEFAAELQEEQRIVGDDVATGTPPAAGPGGAVSGAARAGQLARGGGAAGRAAQLARSSGALERGAAAGAAVAGAAGVARESELEVPEEFRRPEIGAPESPDIGQPEFRTPRTPDVGVSELAPQAPTAAVSELQPQRATQQVDELVFGTQQAVGETVGDVEEEAGRTFRRQRERVVPEEFIPEREITIGEIAEETGREFVPTRDIGVSAGQVTAGQVTAGGLGTGAEQAAETSLVTEAATEQELQLDFEQLQARGGVDGGRGAPPGFDEQTRTQTLERPGVDVTQRVGPAQATQQDVQLQMDQQFRDETDARTDTRTDFEVNDPFETGPGDPGPTQPRQRQPRTAPTPDVDVPRPDGDDRREEEEELFGLISARRELPVADPIELATGDVNGDANGETNG